MGAWLGGLAEAIQASSFGVWAGESAYAYPVANLVHLLCRVKRFREADEMAGRYVREHRDAPAELWIDCGIARHAVGDFDGAARAFHSALHEAPQDATALVNLGTLLVDSGDYAEARRALTAATAAAPDDLHALALLAHCDAHLCRFDDVARAHATIASRLASDPSCGINPFHALAMPLPPAALRQSARHWATAIRPAGGLVVLGAASANTNPLAAGAAVTVAPEVLDRWAGLYRLGPGWYVRLRREGSVLRTRATREQEFPLAARADSLFWVAAFLDERAGGGK